MECHTSDSKKMFDIYESAKCKRSRKKRGDPDDTNSLITDDSNSGHGTVLRACSAKGSLRDVPAAQSMALSPDDGAQRGRDSSHSLTRSPGRERRGRRNSRKHQRTTRESLSLALKAGLVSTPRSTSPTQEKDIVDSIPQDQESFAYAFLEEALKRDKKRQRHSRRHEDRHVSRDRHRDRQRARDRDGSSPRDHRRRHHKDDDHTRDRFEESPVVRCKNEGSTAINQVALFETFAKLCAQLNEKSASVPPPAQMNRVLSHKSLQCEVISRRDVSDVDQQPVRLRSNEQSRENMSKSRSHENFRGNVFSHENIPNSRLEKLDKCQCCYDKEPNHYPSKQNVSRSGIRNVDGDRYPSYPHDTAPPRNIVDPKYRFRGDPREYREYNRDYPRDKAYDSDKRYYEQKTNRSYDVPKDDYPETDKYCRRTARSDNIKEKHYDERKYYDVPRDSLDFRDRYLAGKDRRTKHTLDRFERNSVVSRDDECRDRYSERERDSGLSVADGETSTISGKSNYLRVVKQEIAEQRETMDKMMKLWKELMRCFKGLSTQNQEKAAHDTAANVQESAAAQLRLWRECMRRYETVARDVGDTDARLMEEINKQRSEMAEMAGMWQECLQRYRTMSNDFDSLKQQVTVNKQQFVAPESVTRLPPSPAACAEGEGLVPPAPYRLPHNYPPQMAGGGPPGYGHSGSPLRGRASAPPPWWWCEPAPRSPRRRSSPDSARRRRRDREREDSRYKEKSSKPSGARSEHRQRKR